MTANDSENHRSDAALFIDWDNLKVGLKQLGGQPNISSLLDAVSRRGRVVVARAYADWQQRLNAFDPPNLYAAGIEPVYVPVRTQGGKIVKNSADVKLAVDCIDLLNTAPHLKVFVLVSGDADLVHLVNFLRARGKKVVVIGVSGTVSSALTENVDDLLMYDVDIEPIRQPEAAGSQPRKPKPASDTAKLEEAYAQLEDLLRNRSNRVGSLLSWIGIQLARRGFDYRALGFERLKDFLREAERNGRVRILTRGLQDWVYLPEQYESIIENEVEAEEREAAEEDSNDLSSEVAVAALDEGEQQNFLRYLIELERRSDYLIPPYIVTHLVKDSVLPSLSQSQLRSLVRDAASESILVPSTYTVTHRQTGKPHDLRTVIVNKDHPAVAPLLPETEAAEAVAG
ncbi:MAG TPA: NYN domain-containing protein [Chloroflexota bacterium]|nr:NYN domain-containing protein [Chloroflexota bacterium]